MARKRKETQVIYRPLGKERAWGMAHIGDNKIEIDPRLEGKKFFYVMCHEKYHLQFPELSETQIIKLSKDMTKFLWDNGFRWVDNKK
jgi:hypothetical protein